ncbi:MAG TPA: hypothetical protein VGL02_16940 [Streptomyces sp.]
MLQCVARHKITREKRVWANRSKCEHWFRYGDRSLNLDDWDITDERVPFWGSGMMHPGPDGRDLNGPVYDTPDFKPAGSPETSSTAAAPHPPR